MTHSIVLDAVATVGFEMNFNHRSSPRFAYRDPVAEIGSGVTWHFRQLDSGVPVADRFDAVQFQRGLEPLSRYSLRSS